MYFKKSLEIKKKVDEENDYQSVELAKLLVEIGVFY